jgi:HlyD family secretion protein
MTTATRLRTLAALLSCGAVYLCVCDRAAEKGFLGSAVVEVETYQVTTTVAGQIVALYKDEGQAVDSAAVIAVIDTIPLTLSLREIAANTAELRQQISSQQSNVESAKSDLRGAKREYDRIRALADKGSAPTQQKDGLQTQYESGQYREKSQGQILAGLLARRDALAAREAELRDQLRRCYVTSPCKGTVLTRYRNIGEVAGPAAPIFEMGRYDSVQVDFYVPQPLLADLGAGSPVRIRLDRGRTTKDRSTERFVPAVVSWLSDDAEFSPKNIQTRESRNELVFRVRAVAANAERLLKRGLPVEVWRQQP